MKILLYLSSLLFFCCQQNQNTKQPPYALVNNLNEPKLFSNGKIETDNGIHFSNDGKILYTSGPIEDKFKNGKPLMAIFECKHADAGWVDKSYMIELEPRIDAYHPVLSLDNKTLFFNSRSHPDSTNKSIPHNIWFIKKQGKEWSKPKMVKNINSQTYDSYPSIAENNNLYFNSSREGGKGGMDIYVSHFINDEYQAPVNIAKLNSNDVENDLVIDSKERFIIFNRYINATNSIDLFISFRKNGEWTEPRELDNINSDEKWELTPSLSPDGKYFFYELDRKIMQIELASLIYTDELSGVGNRAR